VKEGNSMQGTYKVGEPIKITYQASGATTGLVDVTTQILDETESLDAVDFPDVVLTENAGIPGEYVGSFTPDVVGTWRTVTDSVTKPGRIVKQYGVVSHNVDSIGESVGNLNDVSSVEVKAEADQALTDYGVAKTSDIVSPPMLG